MVTRLGLRVVVFSDISGLGFGSGLVVFVGILLWPRAAT